MNNKACSSLKGCVYTAQKGRIQYSPQILTAKLIKSSFQIGFVIQDTTQEYVLIDF